MPQQNDMEKPRRRTIRRLKQTAAVGVGVAAIIVASGIWVRLHASSEQASWTTEQTVPTVNVVHPSGLGGNGVLTLPGNLQAFYTARIYARVPGYVRQWYKDIGAVVHRGDILADIDTPELDQQIEQVKADLANAQAAQKLAETTAARWANLLAVDAVSKQEAEEKAGDLAVKNAQVNAAKANVDRLESMKTFARITAPFDGVVTERATDVGALVNAGAGSTGSPLFTVSDLHKIRVYVQVPQNYSAQIHNHMKAELSLPEYPGETFSAQLVSTSDAISDQSNTLLVQLEADNRMGKLKPGEYAQVSLLLPADKGMLRIPSSALVFRGEGLQVATVGQDNHVVMKPIRIANDLGPQVEVSSGLDASDKVIDNPPDSLAMGDAVRVAGPQDQQHADAK
ncbi:MAG TPA: efflux RND transporter periplasmic adaptor subunit [Micropepsaceae bacterium]|jgi:RND family efflux transporter MFP subunit